MSSFATVEQAVNDIRAGKFVIVADDEDRENEGDLICAAELVTPEMVNFMIKKAGGLVCLAMAGDRVDQLGLAPMSEASLDAYRTAYTVSIDASPRHGFRPSMAHGGSSAIAMMWTRTSTSRLCSATSATVRTSLFACTPSA